MIACVGNEQEELDLLSQELAELHEKFQRALAANEDVNISPGESARVESWKWFSR